MQLEPSVEAALSSSFLGAVERGLAERLLERSRIREVPAGRIFVNQNLPDCCGLVLSGWARVYAVRLDGAEVIQAGNSRPNAMSRLRP